MKILVNFEILTAKAGIGTYVSKNAIANIHNMHFFENLKNNSLREHRKHAKPALLDQRTPKKTWLNGYRIAVFILLKNISSLLKYLKDTFLFSAIAA